MVDGRSIYVDVQGSVFWKALPVTLPEIKRIEVQKGPASVLYGFNAFDGIINIITKSPEEIKGATVQVSGGCLRHAQQRRHLCQQVHEVQVTPLLRPRPELSSGGTGGALAYRDNKFNMQTEYALGRESKLSFLRGAR
jgi:iron complex outermembrane recepter protein